MKGQDRAGQDSKGRWWLWKQIGSLNPLLASARVQGLSDYFSEAVRGGMPLPAAAAVHGMHSPWLWALQRREDTLAGG